MVVEGDRTAAAGRPTDLGPGARGAGATSLAGGEILEIRRANRQVRGLLARQAAQARGAEARNARGEPVDPTDPQARSFSIVGAFLATARLSPWQLRTWMAHAHGAAAEILGDPEADVFAFNDAAESDLGACMALLDEIDARVTPFVVVGRPARGGPDL